MDAPPVQYARTSDGFSIAYSVCGEGRPLILFKMALTNLHLLWQHYAAWMEGLAQRFKLICFDAPGEGFSSRGLREPVTLTDFLRDADEVAERFKDDNFLVYGIGPRCHDAVRFAVANPERVDAVILNCPSVSHGVWPAALTEMLPRENWQLFLSSLVPRNLGPEELQRRVQEFDSVVTPEDWNARVKPYRESNIGEELRQLPAPLLVMHPRDFRAIPAEESMAVAAAAAPNARFVSIDGGEYTPGDAAQGWLR